VTSPRALRRSGALLLACAVLLAGVGSGQQPASASGAQNSAVAVNTKDGSSVFRLAFSLHSVKGDVVDPVNLAVAFASCESCQTVAIAIQAVLVSSEPSVVAPVNLALAVNQDCTLCQTLASAYQFVLGTDGQVRLTGQGRQRVSEVRRQLQELRDSGLTIEQIQARTDQLASELHQVLRTELVPTGRQGARDGSSRAGNLGDDEAIPPPSADPRGAPGDATPEEPSATQPAPSAQQDAPSGTTTAPEEGDSAETTDAPDPGSQEPSPPSGEQGTSTTDP
jgi:putative peptide zinc metalloprotease protein